MRVCIDRLSIAMRRSSVGDKALELSIALESVMADSFELGFKISTRGAKLYSNEPEQRVRTKKIINALYQIRSRFVHSGKLPDDKVKVGKEKLEAHKVVEEAMEVVISVAQSLIMMGGIEDWDTLDLDLE